MSLLVGAFGLSAAAVEDVARRVSLLGNSEALSTFSDRELGCYLVWERHVRGVDPTRAFTADGAVAVIVLGRRRARGQGTTGVDTAESSLADLYHQYGPLFLGRIDNRCAGIVIDSRRKTVVLFSDHFGLERVYFRNSDSAFYFASDVTVLLRMFEDSRRIDSRAAGEVLSVGCVMQGRTLFPGIEVLAPAMSVECQAGSLKKRCYLSPQSLEEQGALDEDAFYESLRDTMSRIVPKCLDGKERMGMSLTGGLDGRLVMAWAKAPPGALPCYSFRGPYRDCHDVRIARAVATRCGQSHQVISVDQDFVGRFAELASATVRLSNGTMDVSGAVELYVNQRAREIAPVRITGNYGSEIMRGGVAFRPRRWSAELFEPEVNHAIEDAERTYAEERRTCDLSFIAFKQVPWHHYSRFSVEVSQVDVRSPFLDPELVSLMYRAPRPLPMLTDLVLRLIHDGDATLANIPTDRGLSYGGARPVERLRRTLLDFSAKAEYAYDYGMPQWLARVNRWIEPLHPEKMFLGRHKFYHFRSWYRHALSGYVQDTLLNPKALARSCFRPAALKAMVRQHTSGHGNYTLAIHHALTFELVQQEMF